MVKKCPKCKQEVFQDKVGNWLVRPMKDFPYAESHNISCDNKYLKEKNK